MDKREVKKCKKTLNILHIAATDKENLTSRINKKKINTNHSKMSHAKKNKKLIDIDNKTTVQLKPNINKITTDQSTQSSKITESDLTVDNPSENYWQKLAESFKVALDSALKENVDLHNKVNELEYENSRLKEMLDEAKSLVQVLTEMLEENNSDGDESVKNTVEETKESCDSDLEDISFQSCV